jgi:hypothetical protein
MGRLTEVLALANMTSDQRKRYAYGKNAEVYFTHLTVTTEVLKEIRPPKQ